MESKKMNILEELVKLANTLDEQGKGVIAERIDNIIQRHAGYEESKLTMPRGNNVEGFVKRFLDHTASIVEGEIEYMLLAIKPVIAFLKDNLSQGKGSLPLNKKDAMKAISKTHPRLHQPVMMLLNELNASD